MAEQFMPLYFAHAWRRLISVGFLNGMDNLLGALYSFPGGYLPAGLGMKRALLVFNVVSMIGFIIVIMVPTWPGGIGRRGAVPVVDGDLPARDDEPRGTGVAEKQANDGYAQLHSQTRRFPDGDRIDCRRSIH